MNNSNFNQENMEKNDDDGVWEDLLNSQESDKFLKKLSNETEKDFLSGNTEDFNFEDFQKIKNKKK